MASLLDVLFGCSHKNFSFPITKRRGQRLSAAAAVTGTYVACLDCGKEFPYDWHEMKVIEGNPKKIKALAANAAESLPANKGFLRPSLGEVLFLPNEGGIRLCLPPLPFASSHPPRPNGRFLPPQS